MQYAKKYKKLLLIIPIILLITACIGSYFLYSNLRTTEAREKETQKQLQAIRQKLSQTTNDYELLRNTDQIIRNKKLEEENENIKKTYKDAVVTYEELIKLKESTNKTAPLDENYAKALTLLSDRNYASSSALLSQLKKDIKKKQDEIAASFKIRANVATNNIAPTGGTSSQKVETPYGTFMATLIAGDLNTTRVVVDTASDSDCARDCPVMSVGEFASRSGAFAAINGPYFCPAEYLSCVDKKGSFDTLIMNKNKTYFNSANNVYSSVPAVIFTGNTARFVARSSEWGRDTGVDAVIAGQPLLVHNGEVVFGGDSDPKKGSRGTRDFIGASGNTVYFGVVHNVTTAEMAHVIKTLGIQNAINLDGGGSVALWSNGRYLAGPGRKEPFAILMVRK